MAAALILLLATGAAATTPAATVPSSTSQPGASALSGAALEQQAHEIGQTLRCPVCQGMPISESPSQMAIDMMSRVREMLAAGASREQVYAYFVERYGEWVLLAPKPEGANLGLFILPAAVLLVGLWLSARILRRPEVGRGSPGATAAPAQGGEGGAAGEKSDEEYLRILRDEVSS